MFNEKISSLSTAKATLMVPIWQLYQSHYGSGLRAWMARMGNCVLGFIAVIGNGALNISQSFINAPCWKSLASLCSSCTSVIISANALQGNTLTAVAGIIVSILHAFEAVLHLVETIINHGGGQLLTAFIATVVLASIMYLYQMQGLIWSGIFVSCMMIIYTSIRQYL